MRHCALAAGQRGTAALGARVTLAGWLGNGGRARSGYSTPLWDGAWRQRAVRACAPDHTRLTPEGSDRDMQRRRGVAPKLARPLAVPLFEILSVLHRQARLPPRAPEQQQQNQLTTSRAQDAHTPREAPQKRSTRHAAATNPRTAVRQHRRPAHDVVVGCCSGVASQGQSPLSPSHPWSGSLIESNPASSRSTSKAFRLPASLPSSRAPVRDAPRNLSRWLWSRSTRPSTLSLSIFFNYSRLLSHRHTIP